VSSSPPLARGPGSTNPRWAQLALLLAVVLIAVLPLAWRGTSCGQDFDFHLENWLEVHHAWHDAVFYPHWAASANYGAGEPRFVFYPPFSWMLGAVLGSIVPWTWTPAAFTFLALLGAALSLRAMAREWMSCEAATLAACLYAANPYMLFVVYERGALAELLAATWLPLLVLFSLRRKPAVLPLALSIAALWLTNAPAATMGCYLLAGLVIVAALQQRSWALIRRSLCAVPLGLGLAAFWLIPAVREQRWVQIHRAIGPLMRVEDSFLFHPAQVFGPSPTADEVFATAYHNQVLDSASWIALALIIAAAVTAALSSRQRSRLWSPLVIAAAVIAALQFRWSDFLWHLAPKLEYLQFPWRWMLVLGMIVAALAGLALSPSPSPLAPSPLATSAPSSRRPRSARRGLFRAVAVLLITAGISSLAAVHFWQECDEDDNISAQIATFHDGGFPGTDEYTPEPADNGQIQQGLPPLRVLTAPDAESTENEDNPDYQPDPAAEVPAQIKINRWSAERMSADVTIARNAYAVLRLMDYPAWRITHNGSPVTAVTTRGDGLVVVPLTPGRNQIDVRWVTTADAWIGRSLSLAALAVTLAIGLVERRKTRALPIP
jgi:hypothetical protein